VETIKAYENVFPDLSKDDGYPTHPFLKLSPLLTYIYTLLFLSSLRVHPRTIMPTNTTHTNTQDQQETGF
jgi:hypothetical protein